MPKYKIIFAYDGTRYNGWQVQTNGISIQTILQDKLEQLLGLSTPVTGSGRTDSHVHAKGQVAHFCTEGSLNLYKFAFSLNCLLPSDIRIYSMEEVADDFHARYSAKGKIYHYHLHIGPVENPFNCRYSWHIHQKIDLALLKEAAKFFVGTHDFSSFTNEADRGAAATNPVRTIYRVDVIDEEGGVRIELEGNGFLYKMVRNIVGTMVAVACGKRPISAIPQIFSAKNRQVADKGAPAHGLFLMKVLY